MSSDEVHLKNYRCKIFRVFFKKRDGILDTFVTFSEVVRDFITNSNLIFYENKLPNF